MTATKKAAQGTVEKWDRHHRRAVRRATNRLAGDVTADDVVDTVRQLAADVEEIPAPLRAMENAMHDATRLVGVLEVAGVRFADRNEAPAQIAGAVFAVWLSCHKHPATKPVDWLGVFSMVATAVEWATQNGEHAPPEARRLMSGTKKRNGRTPRHNAKG